MKRFPLSLLIALVVVAAPAEAAKVKQTYFRVGNAADKPSNLVSMNGGVVLMGADQSNYINQWKGTAFQQANQLRINAGVLTTDKAGGSPY